MGDSRLKFEINATDGDGGIQAFIDADQWRTMSIYDPADRRIFAPPPTAGWPNKVAPNCSSKAPNHPSPSCRSTSYCNAGPKASTASGAAA